MSTADQSPTTLPTIFNFETHPIDVYQGDDGAPLFVGRQVCDVLGLKRQALYRLDDDEKGVRSTDTPGGTQEITVINEAGLYSLILRSRKPETKRFRRWVTHEVLPAIRKTGAYVAPARDEAPDTDYRKTREDRLAARERRLATKDRYEAMLRVAEQARAAKIDPSAIMTIEVRAAEFASGMDLGLLLPNAPVGARNEHWLSPTEIGVILGVTANRVGRTIGALGIRTNKGLAVAVLDKSRSSAKTVPGYRYHPDVVDMVRAKLIEDGIAVASAE